MKKLDWIFWWNKAFQENTQAEWVIWCNTFQNLACLVSIIQDRWCKLASGQWRVGCLPLVWKVWG